MLGGMTADARAGARRPPGWLVRATAPLARGIAGRRWFPLWAVVHHVGRRSGTPYAVPVAIVPTPGSEVFLVGLPWGPQTNWARNVVAAGGATVRWKGRDWAATNPRVVGTDVARELTTGLFSRVVGSSRFPAFIVLDRAA